MAFYLKYRPQKIADLDLAKVRDSLGKILSAKEIPHAFLFVGPKGTGKTSSARIVAKAINCLKRSSSGEPCNHCVACQLINDGRSMDLLEIDAASNRGIDDIRELREKIKLAPSKLKYKVYIIDEVHMLTSEAFNALLKTLEEPPQHAKFVLCTTEPHKLPETVVSRCFRVDFDKASEAEMLRSLQKVVKGEKLKISKSGLQLIAKKGGGSFRDAVKILEQLAAKTKNISQKEIEAVISQGLGERETKELIDFLINKQTVKALEWLKKAADKGVDFRDFSRLLVEYLRQIMLVKMSVVKGEPVDLNVRELCRLINFMVRAHEQIKQSVIDSLPLEMAVVEWGEGEVVDDPDGKKEKEEQVAELVAETSTKIKSKAGKLTMEEVTTKWPEILKAIRPHNHSLEALLKATKPAGFENNRLMLEVFYKFHKERLEVERYKQVVETVASKVLVAPIRIGFYLSKQKMKNKVITSEQDDNLTAKVEDDIIKTAEEVFGVEVD